MIGRICIDDPAPPAAGYRYAALAALAEAFGLTERAGLKATLPAAAHPNDDVHDRQHVTAEGRLTANGVVWLERAGVTVELCPDATRAGLILGAGDTLRARATWQGDTAFSIVFEPEAGVRADFLLDDYGRPWLHKDMQVSALLGSVRLREPVTAADDFKIAVLAAPRFVRRVYPAVLAALGDAADSMNCRLSIDLIPTPCDPLTFGDSKCWTPYDGVVLPGGADMERAEPLIVAAEACRSASLPTLGLCLGMQAMCIAAARRTPQLRDAALAEIDPEARLPLFTLLADAEGTPQRRLGDRRVTIKQGSRLARQLQGLGAATSWRERMNHRYRLDPELFRLFAETGLSVLSMESPGEVVDMVEDPFRAFYVGAEGHPELSSRHGEPHPLMKAFLGAIERCRAQKIESARKRT